MSATKKHIMPGRLLTTLAGYIRQKLIVEQCRNTFGFILLLTVSLLIGGATAYGGVKSGILILVVIAALPVVCGIIIYPEFGIIVLLTISYLLFFLMRQGIPFPLGTLMDVIQLLLITGMLFRLKKERNAHLLKGAVSTVILLWIGYNLLAFLNPAASSRLAWVYTVRSIAVVMLLYFVFLYQIRSIQFIRTIFKLWLLLALIGSLYAIKQEYWGFSDSELAWIQSDPRITELFFIDGHWRKFSIFSDPMVYSFNMAIAAIICISLIAVRFISPPRKFILAGLAVLFFITMLYSGTRSAYVLIPAALVLLAIFRYNRTTLIVAGIAGFCALILINIPTSDPLLLRFQTAFKPSDDPSFNVRTINQRIIQPYIQSHPIGGGLGATGVWGQRFAPDSYLANFPPDSGYVRVAVELGWVGLLLFCILMFMILRAGINNYYLIKDPELKSYCMAMTLVLFALNIANYPQEALVQFPTSTLFFLAAALIQVTYRLDQEKQMLSLSSQNTVPAK